ncbi:MAG: CopG family transcriptional regulator [Thiothrix lacustris]|uniref:CopG family transcriptional regulator n=1 Tax=Thiothrix lacustris TaxID=525917 RepID=A0A1Y1Q986_9GAMM|nr:MAG: CopG family transcriptional regulator [Thiothrix lacustris]
MNFALRIPDYYKDEIMHLKGDVSINQFIINALAEKISALRTEAYLQERASRGSRQHALRLLDKVADVPPEAYDRL